MTHKSSCLKQLR